MATKKISTVKMEILSSRKAWENNRKLYIGGSDASSIIGLNPYMSNETLWDIKMGNKVQEDISNKPYVKYGTDAEKHIRALFKLDHPELTVTYRANNSWTNELYPWAKASLDGWLTDKKTKKKGVLEIKTTSILQSYRKENWKDAIPQNYYVQLIHYLLITEFDFAILVAQLKSEFNGEIYKQIKEYRIDRADVLEDIEYLKNEEMKFYESMKSNRRPAMKLPNI